MKTRLPEALLAAAITLLPWMGEAQARTWVVATDGSGDFLLLSEACETAASGDTVNIMPGSYVEEEHDEWGDPWLVISGKALFLRGLGNEPAAVSIKARMRFQGASLVISSLAFQDTSNPFRIEGGSTEFDRCLFEDNDGAAQGGVLDCVSDAVVTITGCTFSRNSTVGKGGAIHVGQAELLIRDCLFFDNQATENGGAIYAVWHTTIERSIFCGNAAPNGAALALGEDCLVRGCTIWGNRATNRGGAVLLDWESTIEQTVIGGTMGGTALSCLASGVFRCCVFWGDERGVGGGFWDCGLVDYLEADPLFCDPENRDFGLREGSPCLPGGYDGCGRIGACDLGCGVDVVLETSWGGIRTLFR